MSPSSMLRPAGWAATTLSLLLAAGPALALGRPASGYYAKPRVEFAFADEATVELVGRDFRSSMKWDYAEVEALLYRAGARDWQRLFAEHGVDELEALRKRGEARRGIPLPDLNNWYTAVLPDDAAASALAAALAANPRIRSASATPLPRPAAVDIAPPTPDHSGSQGYQGPAPGGTGIAAAWAESGGRGEGLRVLHHEGGWTVDHEDYDLSYTGGGNSGDSGWWNHGTACVSILGAPDNGYGVTGMAPALDGLFSRGFWDHGSPGTWIAATTYLEPGDIISASWGYGGNAPPGQTCLCNCGQFGGQPPESNQADFDAIQTVTANGYIVVVSAGNGSVPLDHAYYNGIYDLEVRDSGALMIAAIDPGGLPACWTNHGSRIDAHAWGSAVTSAGYGDLFSPGGDRRQFYTSSFGGTSSACPIVSGALAALQGVHRQANGGAVLDAWQLRTLLRTTGTPQSGDWAKAVANQPDLEALIAAIGGGGPDTTPPLIVHQPLQNTGAAGPYPVQATISDPSGVTAASLHHRSDGGPWSQTAMSHDGGSSWIADLPARPAGSVINYYLSAVDGAPVPNTATSPVWSFTVLSPTAGIVLLTPSGSALSGGDEWIAALAAAGYEGPVMNVDNLDGVVLGELTDALIVLLGVYSDNFVVPAGSELALTIESFVNEGGRVYMEGADCWYYDPRSAGGHDFGALFGVNPLADGSSDLGSVTGHGPLSGTHTYGGANNWIDRLESAGAELLLSNPGPAYNCGYSQQGARITACASFELAGLSGFPQVIEDLFGSAHFDLLDASEPPLLVYHPAALSGAAAPGGTDNALLSLQNIGGRVLHWTAEATQDPYAARPPRLHPALELAKGERDPRPGAGPQEAGGPDGGGYHWIDSDEPGGPAVAFQDISATGTLLSMGDDSNQGPFPLGFTFPFYGSDYSSVRVCSNGFLSFTSSSTAYTNAPIPSSAQPNALVAPCWDDLNPAAGGSVHWQAFADRFIVQWTEVPRYNSSDRLSFQAILWGDGSIEFQYGELEGSATSATVGIESGDGSIGTQVVFNATWLRSHHALRFTQAPPVAPWLSLGAAGGSLAPGGGGSLAVGMDATALPEGLYTGTITLLTDEPASHAVPVSFSVGTLDDQPPLIDHACLGNTHSPGPRTVLAQISDPSGVAAAALVFTVDGGAPQTLAMTPLGGDTWQADLPGQPAPASVLYYIEASDASPAGNSGATAGCSYAVLQPATPQLTVTTLAPTLVQLDWNPVPGALSYRIYRAADLGSTWSLIASTTETTLQLPVQPEDQGLFRVTAEMD
jgi:hypothetical protein